MSLIQIYSFNKTNDALLKQILRAVDLITIDYRVRNIVPQPAKVKANCFVWDFSQVYKFQDRGYISKTLKMQRKVCETDYDQDWDNMIWLPIINLVVSLFSLVFIIKHFVKVNKQIKILSTQYIEHQNEDNRTNSLS